jgi:hypothetical protein
VVWAARDEPAAGPVPGRARPTVRETARRVADGEDWQHAVRELLDGLLLKDEPDLAEPELVTPQLDAYLAAVVEHTCAQRGRAAPPWTQEASRFLERFWWPNGNPAFDALCLVQSPAAFRRRGIFIGATTLHRV